MAGKYQKKIKLFKKNQKQIMTKKLIKPRKFYQIYK